MSWVLALVGLWLGFVDDEGRFELKAPPGFRHAGASRWVGASGQVAVEIRVEPRWRCDQLGPIRRLGGHAWTVFSRTDREEVLGRGFEDRCLLVVVDGTRGARDRARSSLAAMLGSIRAPDRNGPTGPGQDRSPTPNRRARTNGQDPDAGEGGPPAVPHGTESSEPEGVSLVGEWRGEKTTLVLSPNGRFTLGGVHGRWSATPDTLTLIPQGKAPRRFTRRHHAGNRLILRGGGLQADLVLERNEIPQSPDEDLLAALVGRWRSSGVKLHLRTDGTFELGPWNGQWSVERDRLVLNKSPTERLAYRFQVIGRTLVLSGADLTESVRFLRGP